VSSSDVGGSVGRRVLFFTEDAKVLLKHLKILEQVSVGRQEEEYRHRQSKEKVKGELVLF
jgi:hypothetical protein